MYQKLVGKSQDKVTAKNAATTWETVEETANRLTISTRLLRELMKTGTVPFHRAGRRVVLDAVEVDEAIRRKNRKVEAVGGVR
jgi:excisionase family DNA binding protein